MTDTLDNTSDTTDPIPHDQSDDGDCDSADVVLTYSATVKVTASTAGAARASIHRSHMLLTVAGGKCSGCGNTLPADDPAVVAAVAVVDDPNTDWTELDVWS